MIKPEYKHSELTGKIIGCAMKVHNTLKYGFQEIIYQRCMAIEMEKQGLGFEREREMSIYYEGIHVGTRRVDFLVADTVMVELKAVTKLEEEHWHQTMNYLEIYQREIGLLINFGAKSLEFKRFTIEKKLNKIKGVAYLCYPLSGFYFLFFLLMNLKV